MIRQRIVQDIAGYTILCKLSFFMDRPSSIYVQCLLDNRIPVVLFTDKICRFLFVLFYLFRMLAQFFQFLLQSYYVSFFKKYRFIFHNICTFSNIRGQAAVSVAHRFQQAERHPFQITGQTVYIGVAIQFRQDLPLYKPSKPYSMVIRSKPCDLLHECVRIRAAACYDQFFIGIDLLECLDQILDPFFRNDPSQKQNITIFIEAKLLLNQLCRLLYGTLDSVGDKDGFSSISIGKVLLHASA